MKRLIFAIFAIFLVAGAAQAHKRHGHGQGHYHGNASFGLFYGSLSPHGEWIQASFGTAWRPYHVGHAWRPYTKGRWVWSDFGWYWQSYEPFGWATYHYGRWIYDDYYGWIWVPDDVWGPAWVEWRCDNDFVGWAPLPPYASFSASVGITFGRSWVAPIHYWNFVASGNFASTQVDEYIQPSAESRRIYGRTRDAGTVRTVDRRIVNDGVGLDRIERRSREQVPRVDLVDRTTPGEDRVVTRKDKGRDRLEVYRPGPAELRRTDAGDNKRSQVQRERVTQRSAEELRTDRNAQKPADQVRTDRTGQRSIDREVREQVLQRDRERARSQSEVERTKVGERRKQQDVRTDERKAQEVKRPKPPKMEERRGRDG